MENFEDAEAILAEALPGYTHRPQQAELARAVEKAIATGEHLLAEAPVGTGKSWAALIPAILSGKRTIVATATNVLASQYYDKDLPFLAEHLPVDFTYAMVKGKGNYYCAAEGEANKDKSTYVQQIRRELAEHPGHSGDLERFSFSIPKEEKKYLSISSMECPGLSHCQVGRELGCHPYNAKERAQAADIVVTNMSALIVNARLKGAFLGNYELLIIDEGHNLDAYTLGNLESMVNFTGIRDFAERSMQYVGDTREPQAVIDASDYIEQLMESMMEGENFLKVDHDLILEMVEDWMPIMGGVQHIRSILSAVCKRNQDRLEINPQDSVAGEIARNTRRLSKQAENIMETLENLILGEGNFVRWLERVETGARGGGGRRVQRTYLKLSPIESAPFLNAILWNPDEETVPLDLENPDEFDPSDRPPVIVMSGTLATNGTFNFTRRTIGAWDAEEILVDSPFSFEDQARLFTPNRTVPEPRNFDNWLEWYTNTMTEITEASNGAALLLFTSRRAMEAAYERLGGILRARGIRVLIQDGETSNRELGHAFNEDKNSVLFALKSFFEGFDPALGSCRVVVLDKLPFPVPTDIIFEARSQIVEEEGESSFAQLSIPAMSMTLEQAMGRLIRSNDHRGLMAVMDSRLSSKPYGKQILKGLSHVPRVDKISEAVRFLEQIV